MFILTDFLVEVFIILLFSGLLILFYKKDIELTVGKKEIKEWGWGWAIFIWIVLSAIMEVLWYFISRLLY